MKHEKSTTLFVSKEGKIVERGRFVVIDQNLWGQGKIADIEKRAAFIESQNVKKWDPDLKQPPSSLAIGLLWGMMGALCASFYWVTFIWLRY